MCECACARLSVKTAHTNEHFAPFKSNKSGPSTKKVQKKWRRKKKTRFRCGCNWKRAKRSSQASNRILCSSARRSTISIEIWALPFPVLYVPARALSRSPFLSFAPTHTHTLIISGHTIIWLLLCAAHQFSYFCISELGERANGRVWLALVTQFSMFDASCDENAWPFLFVRLCIMHVLCKLNFDKNSKNEHTQI